MARKPTGRPPGRPPGSGGRPAGIPNKVNREFKETVRLLLEESADKAREWLIAVAEGDPAFDRPPDPAKALSLIAQLAEYAAPKLGRIEHMGEDGGPMRQVTTIELEFVEAHAPAYINGHDRSSIGLPAPDDRQAAP